MNHVLINKSMKHNFFYDYIICIFFLIYLARDKGGVGGGGDEGGGTHGVGRIFFFFPFHWEIIL